MHAKARGTQYEMLFMSECFSKGLHPHDAPGDYLAHDVAVMNAAGRFYRVQVKGVSGIKPNRYEITLAKWRSGTSTELDCSKVDIFAGYLEPINTWYLVPCLALNGNYKSIKFYPNTDGGSKARTEPFRNNWDCFQGN
jgi:hypothetical protein